MEEISPLGAARGSANFSCLGSYHAAHRLEAHPVYPEATLAYQRRRRMPTAIHEDVPAAYDEDSLRY